MSPLARRANTFWENLTMKTLAGLVLCGILICGCSGIRSTDKTFVAHAESFRIVGYAIPDDDQAAALARVPEGATITDISATPADWTSFWGVIGNIFWFHGTEITGLKKQEEKKEC